MDTYQDNLGTREGKKKMKTKTCIPSYFVCSWGHMMPLEATSFIFLLHPPATSASEKGKRTVAHKDLCNLQTQAKSTKPPIEIIIFPWAAKNWSSLFCLFSCLFCFSKLWDCITESRFLDNQYFRVGNIWLRRDRVRCFRVYLKASRAGMLNCIFIIVYLTSPLSKMNREKKKKVTKKNPKKWISV